MIHLLLILAAVLVVSGAGLVHPPFALIAAGLCAFGAWYLLDGGSR